MLAREPLNWQPLKFGLQSDKGDKGDKGDDVEDVEGAELALRGAWVPIVSCALFFCYSIIRVPLIDQSTTAAQLSGASCVAIAVVFAAGAARDAYSSSMTLDVVSIYVALALHQLADSALLTNSFKRAPLQTASDPLAAAAILGFIYLYSSEQLPVGAPTLAFSWILTASVALDNLGTTAAALWFAGIVIATFMLGMVALLDRLFATGRAGRARREAWRQARYVVLFVAAAVTVAARDYGISSTSSTS